MIRLLVWALLILSLSVPASATEAGWALLREGGHVALVRHANAPGSGEPSRFDIENCRTQRNLSDRGRNQARRMGALIAARAAPTEKVLASRFCRTLDTARLVFGDRLLEEFEPLDDFAFDDAMEEEHVAATVEAIREYTGWGNFFLVTHEANIRALTGAGAREGEVVIVEPMEDGDALRVLARIVFN